MADPSRGPYNMPPASRDVDDMTYNPQADARMDSAAFEESTDPEIQPIGARGAENQPTYRDYGREDTQTARSEETGRIPRGEVKDILSSATAEEKAASGQRRGRGGDAYKQERDVDRAMEESGTSTAQQDVEIGAATGTAR